MMASTQPQRFLDYEKWFLRASMMMTGLSVVLLGGSALSVYTVQAIPAEIITFSVFYLFLHIAPMLFGAGRILKFVLVIRPKFHAGNLIRSVGAMVITPVSAGIMYIAFILMAFSSCAA